MAWHTKQKQTSYKANLHWQHFSTFSWPKIVWPQADKVTVLILCMTYCVWADQPGDQHQLEIGIQTTNDCSISLSLWMLQMLKQKKRAYIKWRDRKCRFVWKTNQYYVHVCFEASLLFLLWIVLMLKWRKRFFWLTLTPVKW